MNRILIAAMIFLVSSCAVRKQPFAIVDPLQQLIHDSSLLTAHVGVAVYDPVEKKYLFDYQGDKYFVPASNTKIPTLYAGLKFLKDSIPSANVEEFGSYIRLTPAGDPTVMNPEFNFQPLISYLRSIQQHKNIWILDPSRMRSLGTGWAWNDYDASYMAERSAFPLYGNVVSFTGNSQYTTITPSLFRDSSRIFSSQRSGAVRRSQYNNQFAVTPPATGQLRVEVPFITSVSLSVKLLKDSLQLPVYPHDPEAPPMIEPLPTSARRYFTIYSQPVDSLMKIMMHRSDNFFAEQTLLMSAYTFLGIMNEGAVIDTLLKTDLKDLPQRPRWADGSGLSRYNLFSPKDFVAILEKMNNRFDIERMKRIFATGNQGTLVNYYKSDSTFLYAKTGTLSGVVALSGFMYTSQKKLLYFSVLVNNHQASATQVRRAVEKFVQQVRRDH